MRTSKNFSMGFQRAFQWDFYHEYYDGDIYGANIGWFYIWWKR